MRYLCVMAFCAAASLSPAAAQSAPNGCVSVKAAPDVKGWLRDCARPHLEQLAARLGQLPANDRRSRELARVKTDDLPLHTVFPLIAPVTESVLANHLAVLAQELGRVPELIKSNPALQEDKELITLRNTTKYLLDDLRARGFAVACGGAEQAPDSKDWTRHCLLPHLRAMEALTGGARSLEDIVAFVNKLSREELEKRLPLLEGMGFSATVSAEALRRHAIRLHEQYRYVKEHMSGLPRDERNAALRVPAELVHEVMARLGVYDSIAGAIDVGVSWAEFGDDRVLPARLTRYEAQGRGLLRWESVHIGDDSPLLRFIDGSIAGTFGFAPVATLVRFAEPRDTTDPTTLMATYFQGLTWNLTGRTNFQMAKRMEPALVGAYGHTWLLSDTDAIPQSQGSPRIVARARNGSGRLARVWELGGELRMFDSELDIAHHEKSYLNPSLAIAVGLRSDQRFRPGQELEAFPVVAPARWFLRTTVNLNRLQTRAVGQQPKTSSIQFGIDFEAPRDSDRLPAAIRFFLGGDLAVMLGGK